MRTLLTKTALTAGFALAMAFTFFSCSGDDGGGDNNGGGGGSSEYERMKEELKYYDPVTEQCPSGVTERKCGEVWYNPLTHGCDEGGELSKLEFCGNQIYFSDPRVRCQGVVIQEKCGEAWYNDDTHYCDWVYDPNTEIETPTLKAKKPCGNKYYAPYEDTDCQNGVVVERCGDGENWYNPDTQDCSYSYENGTGTYTVKPLVFCGSRAMKESERCTGGVVEEKCGASATWYNDITQVCDWMTGTVRDKVRCGS
jgi:hypothetical protein